jgi:hypothetical protein
MLEFLLLTLALADLPIHCTYKQLLGEWDFFLDLETFAASLDNPKTYCGHSQPGKTLSLEKDQEFKFENEFMISVVFEEPNYAYSPEYGTGTCKEAHTNQIVAGQQSAGTEEAILKIYRIGVAFMLTKRLRKSLWIQTCQK